MSLKRIGVLSALIDGLLLAIWGIFSKAFAQYDPGAFEYSLLLSLAGVVYLLLPLLPFVISLFEKNIKVSSVPVQLSRTAIAFLVFFVIISVVQFYLGVKVYEYRGADVAVSSFLRNSSLIFVAIFAHFTRYAGGIFVESKLTWTSIFGSLLFMLGVWLFFEAPLTSFGASFYLSFWVIGSVIIGFNRALTELLTQRFARVTTRNQMNYGIGWGLLIIGGIGCAVFQKSMTFDFRSGLYLMFVALIIPLMQAFRFTALKYLKEVLGKKGLTIWAYLFSSMILGGIVFRESLAWHKWAGLVIGAVAVAFLDSDTSKAVKGVFAKKVEA